MDLQDVLNIEGEAESEEEYYASIQRAINSGSWGLQGSFGRAMMDAIKAGRCCLGRDGARDYWGNCIPSRDEVKAGTKGSLDFVRARAGDDHADFIGGIE